MLAGISRAIIFSKSVLLILPNYQRTGAAGDFRRKARPEILDNLIVQSLAARAPALCPHQLLDASSQPPELHDMGRVPKSHPQFIAQPRKEGQFKALARLECQMPQVIIGYARGAR